MGGSNRELTKSLPITKGMVYDAYLKIKSNRGSYGVDGMSLRDLEKDLSNQLYKLWNRLSSGSYHPPALRRVMIPKKGKGKRPLGIPTVLDRIAQLVVKDHVELRFESIFHPESYGYRPSRSAHDALQGVKLELRYKAWVIDMDIEGYFDNIDHEKLMKAVSKHCPEHWVKMYIERWLTAPIQELDGSKTQPSQGTPQGGVISPLLSNLYLHYAFDKWMDNLGYGNCFKRYADDIIIHCKSEKEAQTLLERVRERLAACGLTLHPYKTKIVYCGRGNDAPQDYSRKFSFLGYDFRLGKCFSLKDCRPFCSITAKPSASAKAKILQEINQQIKQGSSGKTLADCAKSLNSKLRGWLNYYSLFDKWALSREMDLLNRKLAKWLSKHFKRHKGSQKKAHIWLKVFCKHNPTLFSHWQHGFKA